MATAAGANDPPWLLAQQILVLFFEGATALATTLNDTAPMVHARAAAAQLIDTACSHTSVPETGTATTT